MAISMPCASWTQLQISCRVEYLNTKSSGEVRAQLTSPPAGAVNMLGVRLTDAAWSRIFTELDAAQVFAQNRRTVDELHVATREAVCPNPASLELHHHPLLLLVSTVSECMYGSTS